MTIHDRAIKSLTPADYHLIETEHLRLKKFLNDLRETCCNLDNLLGCETCSGEKLASCRGRLPSFFVDIIDLIDKHFQHEEAIMLSRPHVTEDYAFYRLHNQAHAKILLELNAIIRRCHTINKRENTADAYRQFYNSLAQLFEEHDRAFDDPFIQSTKN